VEADAVSQNRIPESAGLSYVEPVATLAPAALLSGTPYRRRENAARGGLLNTIGEFGVRHRANRVTAATLAEETVSR
jgi:hypothetical protein